MKNIAIIGAGHTGESILSNSIIDREQYIVMSGYTIEQIDSVKLVLVENGIEPSDSTAISFLNNIPRPFPITTKGIAIQDYNVMYLASNRKKKPKNKEWQQRLKTLQNSIK